MVPESKQVMNAAMGQPGLLSKFEDLDLTLFFSGRMIERCGISGTVCGKEFNSFSL